MREALPRPTRRSHSMPFGAQLAEDGGIRFRLWAPAAQRVELVLFQGRSAHHLPLEARAQGWFELTTAAARAGSRYRYRIDGSLEVPDPASRFNPEDVNGPSEVVDPRAFGWDDEDWVPRPWHESVMYELHVGTFSPEGTFAGIERRLDHLVELGVTAIELMPIADFPGARGWGYDGVLPFAPDSTYGRPEELKSLVAAAHRRGLAVMLDVVYNHFGPEGNYLAHYAPPFFTERHCTPWGAAINFDGADARPVRDFYIHNTLYWLEEYHLDGLRYDAVHAIRDDSTPHILSEIARAARSGPGRTRPVYLVLENAANQAHFLGAPGAPDGFDAQWNDDLHHCLHVLLTRESDGYYADYAQHPQALLCRCLAEGFAYQGEHSAHEGHARGEPSRHLPPSAFVNFLQNHDQIGNRALGERIAQLTQDEERLRAIVSVLLLAPSPPLVFMGEEWAAASPFPYFCDFEPELASKVREGRRREFSRFLKFSAGDIEQPPDPAASETLRSASLDWNEPAREPHARMLDHYRRLIALRHREIAPRIPEVRSGTCLKIAGDGAFTVDYLLADGSILHLITNLSERVVATKQRPAGRLIFATHPNIRAAVQREELEPWSVTWLLERPNAGT